MKISIGIPAYNEESNIQTLLHSLLSQKEDGFTIKEIIIMLDGSTDKTNDKIKEINDKRIVVTDDRKRLGKSARLNQMFDSFTGDALFLLDADITIKNTNLFTNIIKQSDFAKDGLVTINALPLPARTYFERIIESGVHILKGVAKEWNHGQNYLSFKGCILALDKKLAKNIRMPETLINNDAFIYLAAREQGFTTRYIPELEAYYKSPAYFNDHLKQASRFHTSQDELAKYFTLNIQKEYKIPTNLMIKYTLRQVMKEPQYVLPYFFVKMLTHVVDSGQIKSTWSIASSTK